MSQNQKKYIADIVPGEEAREIAQSLVEEYPEHGFVIDSDEAKKIGLKVQNPLLELEAIFDQLIPKLNEGLALVGQFKEMNNETQNLPTESETSRINEETRGRETRWKQPFECQRAISHANGKSLPLG